MVGLGCALSSDSSVSSLLRGGNSGLINAGHQGIEAEFCRMTHSTSCIQHFKAHSCPAPACGFLRSHPLHTSSTCSPAHASRSRGSDVPPQDFACASAVPRLPLSRRLSGHLLHPLWPGIQYHSVHERGTAVRGVRSERVWGNVFDACDPTGRSQFLTRAVAAASSCSLSVSDRCASVS